MQFYLIKMTYSIEPRDRVYVKGYECLSFAKNVGKNLSNKYGQKLLDSAKKSTTDTIKTASKRAIKKTAEAMVDLIGNKIVDKITCVPTKKSAELFSTQNDDANSEIEACRDSPKDIPKKRYISPKKRQQIIDELRLV